MEKKSSDLGGFYKLGVEERLKMIQDFAGLDDEEVGLLRKTGALNIDTANSMIENVIGAMQLPVGIATNFLINGRDYLVPMAIEEPSVVAAASHAAKLARLSGGFRTSSSEPVMIGQIQLIDVPDMERAKEKICANKETMFKTANNPDSTMVKLGGGLKDIYAKELDTKRGRMLIVYFLVDVMDAMGANAVNRMVEELAPITEDLTGGKARLKIMSNLATNRIARARAVWGKDLGEDIINGILDAFEFAVNDQYRCTTNNKGIMNGIDAVALATGQDFRALESAAHSYACIDGRYKPLAVFEKDAEGNLVGSIEMPIAVGIVGGSVKTNPVAKIGLKILGVKTSQELAEVMAAVGLANNFAALRAMVYEGIQKGHMKLHARNIAISAGAGGALADKIAAEMTKENNISFSRAKAMVDELTAKNQSL